MSIWEEQTAPDWHKKTHVDSVTNNTTHPQNLYTTFLGVLHTGAL